MCPPHPIVPHHLWRLITSNLFVKVSHWEIQWSELISLASSRWKNLVKFSDRQNNCISQPIAAIVSSIAVNFYCDNMNTIFPNAAVIEWTATVCIYISTILHDSWHQRYKIGRHKTYVLWHYFILHTYVVGSKRNSYNCLYYICMLLVFITSRTQCYIAIIPSVSRISCVTPECWLVVWISTVVSCIIKCSIRRKLTGVSNSVTETIWMQGMCFNKFTAPV